MQQSEKQKIADIMVFTMLDVLVENYKNEHVYCACNGLADLSTNIANLRMVDQKVFAILAEIENEGRD